MMRECRPCCLGPPVGPAGLAHQWSVQCTDYHISLPALQGHHAVQTAGSVPGYLLQLSKLPNPSTRQARTAVVEGGAAAVAAVDGCVHLLGWRH